MSSFSSYPKGSPPRRMIFINLHPCLTPYGRQALGLRQNKLMKSNLPWRTRGLNVPALSSHLMTSKL